MWAKRDGKNGNETVTSEASNFFFLGGGHWCFSNINFFILIFQIIDIQNIYINKLKSWYIFKKMSDENYKRWHIYINMIIDLFMPFFNIILMYVHENKSVFTCVFRYFKIYIS